MILVAPTAFKGTHTAAEVAAAMRRGAAGFESLGIHSLPVSDGGPGLLDALAAADWQPRENASVIGPLGAPVPARIHGKNRLAAIESADACGLSLVPVQERSPWRTTTFGVGELLLRAAAVHDHVLVGLGGSATIDGGLGMASALGWSFLDERGRPVAVTGRGVLHVAHITGAARPLPRVTALADVRNPLTGPNGAARVFGPQKGASVDDVAQLDAALEHFAALIRRDLGRTVGGIAGGGAAGGLGAGLAAFADATVVAGSDWLLAELGFDQLLRGARLVITGEGAYDEQSCMGKITGEVIARAGRRNVPVLLIAGRVDGVLPRHVHAPRPRGALELVDIEALVRASLPQLLAP